MPIAATSFSWKSFVIFFALYLIILAANGYVFGADDQVEVLPYALFLQDPSLYPTDFYVQYISRAIPNERYFFSSALALSGKALPFLCGLMHLLCSLFLLGGLYRISQLFIQSDFLRWGVLLAVCLPPFYGINLGGNELYYNTFIPSLLAKAIGIWGLFYFLKRRYRWSILLLALCTFFHPVAGAQLFLILGGVLLWEKISGTNPLSWKKIGGLFLSFLLTAGAWVLFLKFNFDKGAIDKTLLFEIMEFRVPHHYFPSYFPLKYFAFLLLCYAVAMYFFWKKDRRILAFFVLTLLGCGLYTLGVEILESPSLLTAQWFKSTIWLKAFSFMAIVALAEENLPPVLNRTLEKAGPLMLGIAAAIAIGAMLYPFSVFKNKPYDFAWRKPDSPIIDMALQAKEKTAIDATFVIPFPATAFKFHSQRSCYIDYKTVVHRKDALPVWYRRVEEIYGINIADRRARRDLAALAALHYSARTEEEWQVLSKGKFQYLLMPASKQLNFPMIAENDQYRIYQIQ